MSRKLVRFLQWPPIRQEIGSSESSLGQPTPPPIRRFQQLRSRFQIVATRWCHSDPGVKAPVFQSASNCVAVFQSHRKSGTLRRRRKRLLTRQIAPSTSSKWIFVERPAHLVSLLSPRHSVKFEQAADKERTTRSPPDGASVR